MAPRRVYFTSQHREGIMRYTSFVVNGGNILDYSQKKELEIIVNGDCVWSERKVGEDSLVVSFNNQYLN